MARCIGCIQDKSENIIMYFLIEVLNYIRFISYKYILSLLFM